MNITKKWRTAAAGALALALVGGGAVSASAAEGDILNPQPNGSPGSFHLWSGDTFEMIPENPETVFTLNQSVYASPSATDMFAEFNPAPDRVATGANSFNGVYLFISERNAAARDGGTNTWKASSVNSAAGPNGGTLGPEFTLNGFQGVDALLATGGDYWYGIAYTINTGVTVVGAIYRDITILPGGAGNYTLGPIQVEGAAPVTPVTEDDLTPALEVSTLVATTTDSTVLTIDAGAANANKTLNVGAFSAPVDLGQITLDANGVGTVDVAGKGLASGATHKLYLAESDNTVVAWGSFSITMTYSTEATAQLRALVNNSGRFELVAPLAPVIELGTALRNTTTTPVSMGEVTVYDDRDNLLGWNLNITAADFAGPNSSTVAATALGYAPVAVALTDGATIGAAKTAGEGSFGVLAEGAAGSSTAEVGAVIDANLTFKAPIDAEKGEHLSTLTLTLVSK